jgi:hypothetical protein
MTMTDDSWLTPGKGPGEKEVAFDYVKAVDFRVVWADGVIGGLTPNGLVHCALYAERGAIPRRQVFKIDSLDERTGQLGAEVLEKQISRGSIVREMACDVFLSAQAAENLANWLLSQVALLKKINSKEEKTDVAS